jgi:cysteinyl-tRNA synthetase
LGGVLGLTFAEPQAPGQDQLAAKPFIEMLLDTRQKLREAKQYALADQIRDDLDRAGVILEDTTQGAQWHYRTHS